MLQHLSIKNYALIDHLDLDFYDGFSVITGETGAGKSIMLNALALILGKRADLKSIKNQELKCVVEGSFKLDSSFKEFFTEKDLDFEDASILRREITPSGKSRAFVNDTPVTLEVLSALAQRLIDVHSQHQNLLLTDQGFQLDLLDSFAQNEKERAAYTKAFIEFKATQKELENFKNRAQSESGDTDYLQFLLEELLQANLKEGEQEQIEKDLQIAENAESIQLNLSSAIHSIEEDEFSAIENLKKAASFLNELSGVDEFIQKLADRVESCRIEMDDVSIELKEKLSNAESNPSNTAELDERLSLIINLQRKHQVQDLEELIEKRDALDNRIQDLSSIEDKIKNIKGKLSESLEKLSKTATNLANTRQKVIPNLEEKIKQILDKLNMSQSEFLIEQTTVDNFTEKGNTTINFLFTANKGMAANKLSKVASGGELSRVMLALKAIMAETQNLPSIIFDEIDTGVSGETAGKIGEILKQMGGHMQVITISHLPQIASLGHKHYKVFKTTEKNSTKTQIIELNESNRVEELARLLSGEQISEAALANAKQLLGVK